MRNFRLRVTDDEAARFEQLAPQFGLSFNDFFKFCASYGLKTFELMAHPSPELLKLVTSSPDVQRASDELGKQFEATLKASQARKKKTK